MDKKKESFLTFSSKVFVQIGSKITSYHPFIIFKEKFFLVMKQREAGMGEIEKISKKV
jgi:hypothetical protein